MPLSPRKCCGKKVRFTPINIIINCLFIHRWCGSIPVIIGIQWLIPAKIAKTAPILRT